MSTINLSWSASAGSSSGSYRVKYWLVSDPSNIIVVDNVIGTSYSIQNVNSAPYAGTIESRCGDGSYSSTTNWNVTPGGGTVSVINGTNSATCSSGATGTIVVGSAETKKVQLTTVYYSVTGSSPLTGATLTITQAGSTVDILSATATAAYTPATDLSVLLIAGTYNYTLTQVNCNNGVGSGTTSFTLVNP